MKKTSKKLLSLFLAVVMIVTSCSVGLTAFAADGNPTDKYWNDSTSASEAFDKLNDLVDTYVPAILNIEISEGQNIGALLGMSDEQIESATLSQVVSAASPMLLGLLGTNGDKETVLKKELGYSEDQILPKRYNLYFSYLDGTENDKMSFYDLYQFCADNKSSSNTELADWCTTTLAKLQTLIKVVSAAEAEYKEAKANTDAAYIALVAAINKTTAKITNAPKLEDIENLEVSFSFTKKAGSTSTKINVTNVKINELANNAEYGYIFQDGINSCNTALANAGVSLRAESTAEAVLYYYSNYYSTVKYDSLQSSAGFAFALNFLKFAELAGTPITTENLGEANPRNITVDNYDEVLGSLLSTYPGTKNDNEAANKKYFYYTKMILAAMMDLVTLDANGWVSASDVKYESFASSKYESIMKGSLLSAGYFGNDMAEIEAVIEANRLDDETLAKLHEIAVENEWMGHFEKVTPFLQSDEGRKLVGEYMADYLVRTFFSNNARKNQASLFCNAIATSVDDAKAYVNNLSTDQAALKVRGKGVAIPLVQYLNETVSGIIAISASTATVQPITGFATARFDTIEAIKYTAFIKPAIEESGASYAYEGDLVIPEEFVIEAVNSLLNNTLGSAFDESTKIGGIIVPIINALLESNVDLLTVTKDLWKDLYENPVATIFNLIPTLVILVDELLVPLVLNDGDTDQYAGTVYNLLCTGDGIFTKYTLAAGNTDVGITSLNFDLNKILPSILYWFSATATTNEDTADSYRRKVYKLVSYYNEEGTGKISHGGIEYDIPRFTGIYVADKALAGVWLTPNLARTIYCSMENEDKESTTYGTAKANKDTQNLADGLVEMIAEIVNFARVAVDEYLANHGNDIRYNASEATPTQRGLNNIFVALPELIDIFGKKFINKYGINSDWTYTYSNKIYKATKVYTNDDSVEQYYNKTLEDFKALATEKQADAVLESFVNILIGNWVNSLLDIVNDTITGKNRITENFALVQGLLEALGGFGEKSIITDVFNGLFDLKRSDKASFTLKKQADTGFVGFSTASGLFLLSNLQFDNGKKGIIPLIIGVVNGAKTTAVANALASATQTTTTTNSLSSTIAPLAGAQFATLGSAELLSKKNLDASQKLIDKLDAVLKSLLDNTSINDFTLTSNDNILAGVVSTVSRYIGTTNTSKIIDLLDQYLKCLETNAVNGKVDAGKVYTSKNLSKIVIDTYTLIEDIVDYLFYDTTNGFLRNGDEYKVIAGAVTGIISPDSLSVRMTGEYKATSTILGKYNCWSDIKDTTDLKFAMKNGDKASFYDALGQSLSSIAAILSAVLAKSYTDTTQTKNYYSELLYPVLSTVAGKVGAKGVMSPAAFNKATVQAQLVKGVITPISNILTQIYDAPATFILNVVSSLGGLLNDKTLTSLLDGAVAPINALLNGIKTFIGSETAGLNAPSMKAYLNVKIPVLKINLPYKKNIIVNLINNIDVAEGQKLKDVFEIPNIDWLKLYKADAKTTLLLVYGFAADALLKSDLVVNTIKGAVPELYGFIKNLDAASLLQLIGDILGCFQSPTQAYWTFKHYAPKTDGIISNSFKYPKGITAADAEQAVANIDGVVQGIFPLLKDLGVADIESLSALVNDKLYTNEILTTIATALYGALYDKVILENGLTELFKELGLDLSPRGFAAYLTDKSYGNTYSDAAAKLKKAKTWGKVKSINWGFKNGSANAQKGFINGLAAMFRPFNEILAVLLADNAGFGEISPITEDTIDKIIEVIGSLDFSTNFDIAADSDAGCRLTLKIKNGMLTLSVRSKMSDETSTVKCNLENVVATLLEQLTDASVNFGTNGYESAVIPILEAFICKDVKTYAEYKKDYKAAKDNLLIDVLNPIFGLVNDVLEAPIATVTKILPNVAYFIDNNGLAQAIGNLLAPITSKDGVLGILKDNGLDVDELITLIAGDDLGSIITDAIGIDVKLNLELGDLAACNIQDIVLPLVRKILKDKNIKVTIPNFTFKALYSHGTLKTVKSAARNAEGNYTTKRIVARQGEVLVAVLRYVAEVLIKNATSLSKLICGIDKIAKNKTLKNIIQAVFAQIRTATPDDIVIAVFGIISQTCAQDSFFDYSDFTYKNYEFSFGEMDEDFCRKLAPMLDGLVNGLLQDKGGLLGLLGGMLYTDELISKMATGLYGAIEGVKIGDSMNLAALLAQLDIDFSTENVAALLTDKTYGQTYESSARVIKNAGKWSKVNASSLSWGVKDRDTFVHALVAVLRPVYGVLDILLNNGQLNIFNILSVPGSDGYTSSIVPLMEAFGLYNIKTQYQYREDMEKEYDAILLDILNPLLDKVEDILNAPIEMVADILPNLSLFFANNGLLQLIDNLLTPVSALINAVNPIVDLNKVIDALGLDINGLLKKIGITAKIKIDVYDLKSTLEPLIGADNVVSLLNGILGIIKIKGTPLGLELPEIDWFQLASHGEYILNATSQAATIGSRIAVKADQDETLIAVLRYLINTINYKDNYNTIVNLLGGLLGGLSDSIAGVIDQVLGMLQGDADEVIKKLVDLLQSIAG